MSRSIFRYGVVALAAGLVACGGDGGSDAELRMASDMAGRMHALSVTPTTGVAPTANALAVPTPRELFDWAEYKYADLFPKPATTPDMLFTYEGVTYTIRGFSNGNYLGVTASGEIFGLGPFTNDVLTSFGRAQDYVELLQADRCNVNPASCEPPPPVTGSYNQCVDPAAMSLPTGFNTRLVYAYSGTITGEQTVESTIEGAENFEGQSAIRIKSTTSGTNTVQGVAVTTNTEIRSYARLNANGLQDTLGSLVKVTIPGLSVGGFTLPDTVTESRTVFSPPLSNIEYTLQPGGSVTKNYGSTTTFLSGPAAGSGPDSTTLSEVHTFQAVESITVQGRSFQTCRYTVTVTETSGGASETTTSWLLVGKGVLVKSQGAGQVIELKSGTYNGSPI